MHTHTCTPTKLHLTSFILAVFGVLAISAPTTALAAEEVNLYSYRQPFLIKPLLNRLLTISWPANDNPYTTETTSL